jgi:hypothetical protein
MTAPTDKAPQEKTTKITVVMPTEHVSGLQRLADINDRTLSQEIRRLVRKTLEQEPVEEAA